jgi:hypothetical protein
MHEALAEDFPWVQEVRRRREGLLVPAAESEVIARRPDLYRVAMDMKRRGGIRLAR